MSGMACREVSRCIPTATPVLGSGVHAFVPFRDDQQGEYTMTDDDNFQPDKIGMSRRSTLTLAAGVAALGVALGMRSNAFAQGKGEGKMEGKGEGNGDGKRDGKGDGKGEGKGEGKEGRREGKAGRIKVDVESDGTTSVDVKCAEDEPMRACADLTKEIIDRIKGMPVK
jgi:hypothetical protein